MNGTAFDHKGLWHVLRSCPSFDHAAEGWPFNPYNPMVSYVSKGGCGARPTHEAALHECDAYEVGAHGAACARAPAFTDPHAHPGRWSPAWLLRGPSASCT